MPTKKKVVQAVLDDNYHMKFEYLRAREDRTASNMAAKMIKNYIDQYEKMHGEIKINEE